MLLTNREIEKLQILSLAFIAERRKDKGLKLNHPEAVAFICADVLEGAREGKTVEQTMVNGSKVLSINDVMDGVADLIPFVQIEAVFTDGSRLVTIHNPIR
ncbi:urease subunit gamma [Photobacterium damselae]|uniref:urease subunit gamma n=1 Tax=Photobacterium damselae TaxID=38293 RepID=UPI001EED7D86|nr:urease subunit gamma [Photobacterium damselae]UKA11997.1 urease subunit gamma [Photobacterium damselae subsp. damselae]